MTAFRNRVNNNIEKLTNKRRKFLCNEIYVSAGRTIVFENKASFFFRSKYEAFHVRSDICQLYKVT